VKYEQSGERIQTSGDRICLRLYSGDYSSRHQTAESARQSKSACADSARVICLTNAAADAFALSGAQTDLTKSGVMMGEVDLISPEQATNIRSLTIGFLAINGHSCFKDSGDATCC